MANRESNLDLISVNQSQKEVTANELFNAASQAMLYGRRASLSTGLTFGYYGGNIIKSNGDLEQVPNGTVALTASDTNYIVADKSDGTVSVSTGTTDWNDRSGFWRLYEVTTGAAGATDWVDHRELGSMTNAPGGAPSGGREILTTTREYYVRTDGDDNNDGLTNSAGGAFKTITKAMQVLSKKIDTAGNDVFIRVADGTYDENIWFSSPVGGGGCTLSGNNLSPGNVVVNSLNVHPENGANLVIWNIEGVGLKSKGNIDITNGAFVRLRQKMQMNGGRIIVNGGTLDIQAEIEFLAASYAKGFFVFNSGRVSCSSVATLFKCTGVVSFTIFAEVKQGSLMTFTQTSPIFTGSPTGKRYEVSTNSVIDTNGGGASYLPGGTAGTVATGGVYA